MTKETFFIQVPPGLEELAQEEFVLKFVNIDSQIPETTLEKGGLLVQLPLEQGVKLNYWLKIPNRILLRLTHFRCRDLPKLFNKVSKLPLSPYFADQEFQFKISAFQSRLFDSRKIEKTLKDALAENTKRQEPRKKSRELVSSWNEWRFYCRFEDDWCDLSIDTSGERLGKRGKKTKVGKAPLRENLASALYFATLRSLDQESIEQIYHGDQKTILVDPFAGSGTILTEAMQFFRPAIHRNFSFQYFPCFLGKEESVRAPKDPELQGHTHLIAGEYSEEQYIALEENLNSLQMDQFSLVLGDSFNGNLKKVIHDLNPEQGISFCITNPPYGKRIQTEDRIKIHELLKNIFELSPFHIVGILMPKEFSLPEKEYNLVRKISFSHGGTPVNYSLWKNKTK